MRFNLLNKLGQALGRSTSFSSDPGPNFLTWAGILRTITGGGIRKTQLTSPTQQHPIASGAIRLAGTMLGGVPWRIVEEDKAAKTRLQEALERGCESELRSVQEFERLANRYRPASCSRMYQAKQVKAATDGNPWEYLFEHGTAGISRSELFSATVQQMLGSQTGSCYWLLRGGLVGIISEDEVPREVSVWPSSAVKAEKTGEYTFTTKRGKIKYPAHQVLYFRNYAAHAAGADSPLRAAFANMQSDVAAQEWNAEFFENGAQVGNVLSTDQKLTPDQADAHSKMWDEKHKANGKTAVLGQGVTLTATTGTHREMDFVEGFKVNEKAVLACLLVHKAALGVTDDLNRATIDAARQMMWSNLLIPLGSYIEDVCKSQLFSRFENGRMWGVFDISGVPELADDVGTKAESLVKLTTAGIPMNDAIKATGLDLPVYSWGDDPMGHVTASIEEPKQEAPRNVTPSHAMSREEAANDRYSRAKNKADAWWHSVGTPVERKFQGQVRKVFLEVRKEVLNNVGAKRSDSRGIDEAEITALLFDVNRYTEVLREGTEGLYQRTIDSAFEGIMAELSEAGYQESAIKFNLNDKAILRYLETKDVRLRHVMENVRNEIQKAITAKVKENATVHEIAKEIRRVSNYQLKPSRTLMIARTETGSASNNVRWLGMEAAGVGHISWVASSDAREEHKAINDLTLQAAVDGEPYERGTDFAQLVGAPGVLRFPHDPQGDAGMVINCRCRLVAEIDPAQDLLA